MTPTLSLPRWPRCSSPGPPHDRLSDPAGARPGHGGDLSLSLAGAQRRVGRVHASTHDRYLFRALLWFLGGTLVAFILLPILHIYVNLNPSTVVDVAGSEGVLAAIGLSVKAAIIASGIAALLGGPLAYRLSRDAFPGKGILEALVDLPLAVPHSVAGIALLFVFGRQGVLGRPLAAIGLQFWGSLAGIVVGMLFVSCPFMVNTARLAFDAVDPELEEMAATMGASPAQIFWFVALPLSLRGLFSGAILTYARSLAEFGAIVVLAYYPMTAPVKIYDLFLQGGLGPSTAGAALLLAVALSTFLALRFLNGWRSER